MNTRLLSAALIVIAIFGIGGVILWMSLPPAMPPVQKMEQSIPDDHIPH